MQREAKGVVALPTHGFLFIIFLRHLERVALKPIALFAVDILSISHFVLFLRSGDITFGMDLYRQPESRASGKFFC